MGSGGGNALDKVTGGAEDLWDSVKDDPLRTGSFLFPLATGGIMPTIDSGTRVRDDQRDQAAGAAQKEADRAAQEIKQARADAINRGEKAIDPLALERRRRASITRGGRGDSILTAGTSLGADDVARKALLGL